MQGQGQPINNQIILEKEHIERWNTSKEQGDEKAGHGNILVFLWNSSHSSHFYMA